MSLYPLFADLRGRPILVVGGGAVAQRKISRLLDAGAAVTVASPHLHPSLSELARAGSIVHRQGGFHPEFLDGQWLAIAATGNRDVNRAVADAAQARGILVNVVDDAELSSFHVPAVIDRAPVQIAISTAGAAPMLARVLREKVEALLDHSVGSLARLLDRYRLRIRERHPDVATRRRFYTQAIAGPVAALLRRAQPADAEAELQRTLVHGESVQPGSVVLVGAGPGDPGLLTLNGLRALNEADVILHDHLVDARILELARRDAQFIDVGKRAGAHTTKQDRIHELLLEHARLGKRVVRLKGGDPFVFGRGGEEIEFLRGHGIAYEVVPGITAAMACAAYSGIPLTHREHAQSVRFVTAHCRDSLDVLDWRGMASERQTLAVYMGVGELGTVRDRLISHGRNQATPFALIENGSRPNQRVVTGILSELVERAHRYVVTSPAVLIIGDVAALADRLHWFGSAPLGSSAGSSMPADSFPATAQSCA